MLTGSSTHVEQTRNTYLGGHWTPTLNCVVDVWGDSVSSSREVASSSGSSCLLSKHLMAACQWISQVWSIGKWRSWVQPCHIEYVVYLQKHTLRRKGVWGGQTLLQKASMSSRNCSKSTCWMAGCKWFFCLMMSISTAFWGGRIRQTNNDKHAAIHHMYNYSQTHFK